MASCLLPAPPPPPPLTLPQPPPPPLPADCSPNCLKPGSRGRGPTGVWPVNQTPPIDRRASQLPPPPHTHRHTHTNTHFTPPPALPADCNPGCLNPGPTGGGGQTSPNDRGVNQRVAATQTSQTEKGRGCRWSLISPCFPPHPPPPPVPAGCNPGCLNPGPWGGSNRGVARRSNLTNRQGGESAGGIPGMPDSASAALLAGLGAGDS